jgi:hypothetical protein
VVSRRELECVCSGYGGLPKRDYGLFSLISTAKTLGPEGLAVLVTSIRIEYFVLVAVLDDSQAVGRDPNCVHLDYLV